MLNEVIGKYLLKLRDKTFNDQLSYVDMYKIGEEIGLVHKIQSDHIVEILLKDGYILTDKVNSKIRLSEAGYERLGDNHIR